MITLITGPMKCGKSTEVYRQMERKHIAGKKVLYISAKKDTRDFFARGIPRSQLFEVACVQTVDDFAELDFTKIEGFDAIFVDEFFMIKNNLLLVKYIFDHKVDIYLAGLISDARANMFPEAIKILPYCDEIVKLSAVCELCGSEHANYSYLAKFKLDKNGLAIGDDDYKVLCRKCFLKAFKGGENE